MVKEGPCYHCGTETTPLWRNGPPAKPVLCNACGSRWRTRGSLKDYVPKHAMRETQNSQTGELPAIESFDQSASNSPDEENAAGSIEPNFDNIPKRRRSNLDQLVLSPMERLNKQLYNIAQEQQDVYMNKPVAEDILIDQANNMMSTAPETLLGAMLLSPNEPEPTESVSSTNARTCASASTENGSDQGESSAT